VARAASFPSSKCPVHDERGNAFAFAARDTLATAGPQSVDTLAAWRFASAARTRELMAALVVSSDRDRPVRSATRRLIEDSPPTSMHLNVHTRDDAFIFGPSTRHLHGSQRMREQVAGAAFLISPPRSFRTKRPRGGHARPPCTRCSGTGPERRRAAKHRVLDLYAGSGLFAIPARPRGQRTSSLSRRIAWPSPMARPP